MTTLWELFLSRAGDLNESLVEHLWLSGIATLMAVAAGVPLGVLAQRSKPARDVFLGIASIFQTVPSLAMLTFLLPFFGIGATPAIIALTLYALLPILRNTYTGLSETPPGMIEMAKALGMTRGQRLWMVEARFAAPFVLAGVRTAAVISVGIATLSAFIGAGGLGTFINRGLALNNTDLVLLGAIPAGLLALYIDFLLGTVEQAFRPMVSRSVLLFRGGSLIVIGIVAIVGLASISKAPSAQKTGAERIVVAVGSKNFTEQFILGEIVAQLLESDSDIRVVRRFNLAGTAVCHEAILKGDIDLYVEYTGTALVSVLGVDADPDSAGAWDKARRGYQQQFDLTWLAPLGFANTYAVAVRQGDAVAHGWNTISDLRDSADRLRGGFTFEFLEREDGYPGLSRHYGFSLGSVVGMDPGLMYEALRDGRIDAISAFSTDGRIAAYDLALLEDDRRFFPPYDAGIIVRSDVLVRFPEVQVLLERLSNRLDEETMQRLNYAADAEKIPPRRVAREFLESVEYFRNEEE